jgi:hypothetical protein
MKADQKRILLVHLYANGDCLYATAVARQIKKDFPGAHLTWAIHPQFQSILLGNPDVDAIRVVEDVPKNDTLVFKVFRKKLEQEKADGLWDELFITSNIDNNQAYYDGTVRGMILRAYPHKINVSLQPELNLTPDELNRVADFASQYRLSGFKHVILWEYAPQSGQSTLQIDWVKKTAELITQTVPNSCVILSSAHAFESTHNIINASPLTVRENAALSHYCHLLIGCSSGITWLCTSKAGKMLPMIQLLNPNAIFLNAPSTDFSRYNIPHQGLVEMTQWSTESVLHCTKLMLEGKVDEAHRTFHQSIPVSYSTSKKIIYDRICFLQFKSLFKHLAIMYEVNGNFFTLIGLLIAGLVSAPFTILSNRVRKKRTTLQQSVR